MSLDPTLAQLLGPEITQDIDAVQEQDLDVTEPFPKKRYACALFSLAMVVEYKTPAAFASIVNGLCIAFPEKAEDILTLAEELQEY